MVNILEESCSLCRSQYIRGKKIIHRGQYTIRKLFTVSWSVKYTGEVIHCGQYTRGKLFIVVNPPKESYSLCCGQ